jgi:Na+/phosphate symporter
LEDRFFGSVFYGSGLLFLALSFASAAVAGGLVIAYSNQGQAIVEGGTYTYGRALMYVFSNTYAMRMAGVFMISFATIALRTGVMSRAWAIVTYVLALVLLLSIGYTLWVTLVFPAWVFAVSVIFLITEKRS